MPVATDLPRIIQGGMGVAVSNWVLARAVSQRGQLGVVSGTALDLVIARRLQDGDEGGHVRRALEHFPIPAMAERVLTRYFIEGGRDPQTPYAPIPRMAVKQSVALQELGIVGAFVETWLAKEGHDGVVGINLLEKIQMATPTAAYGAMLAGVDAVLMGAGVPRELPRLLNTLAAGEAVQFPVDVDAAGDRQFFIELDMRALTGGVLPPVTRPIFLAIVSAHVLAGYLVRDPEIRPDGFIVEGSVAGGHNAPPRKPQVDERGDIVFGPRDEPDLEKVAALGLPFWIAGAAGTPSQLQAALDAGAHGVQVGTVFALSQDSGLTEPIRADLLSRLRAGTLEVRTSALASPTGFPFKVAQIDGTIGNGETYSKRPRLCDLGYLRTPFVKEDGALGYRCAAEPEHMYVKKGGDASAAVNRACLCNGLAATHGLGQHRADGYDEAPLVTLGSDLTGARMLLERYPNGWTAAEVVDWLLGG